MTSNAKDSLARNRVFAWIALAACMVLLIPLLTMQFSEELKWDPIDFVVMGILLFCAGSVFEMVARRVNNKHRNIIGITVLTAFLYVWAELAVGIFTDLGS